MSVLERGVSAAHAANLGPLGPLVAELLAAHADMERCNRAYTPVDLASADPTHIPAVALAAGLLAATGEVV